MISCFYCQIKEQQHKNEFIFLSVFLALQSNDKTAISYSQPAYLFTIFPKSMCSHVLLIYYPRQRALLLFEFPGPLLS